MTERRARRNPPIAERVVLDSAHIGDIHGALGTLKMDAERPRGFKRRVLALLAIVGPGIIVMVGDNDAGGVATYSQAGQNYGTSLLWVLLLLIPVLIVNQEMVVRLGAVTGMGHGKLIFERFGKLWGAFSIGDLFILDFLTLVTEFIGVSLAFSYFGVSPYISVPAMAALLVLVTVTGSFQRWERFMFFFIAANFLVIPLLLFAHAPIGPVVHDFIIPGVKGGLNGTSALLIIAIVGTTVAPWQLFFQQSNIVDKRITPRWIPYERLDTIVGSLITVVAASAIVITCAFAFRGTHFENAFTDAGGVAHALAKTLGPAGGAMYAIILLNASLIGAAALSIATSYAVGDTFGIKHSLHRGVMDAKGFYASFTLLVFGAAAVVLIPNAPLGLITTGVQALAGVLLPAASVYLLILCNDRAILGPWVNPRWLNVISVGIISTLVILSLVLTVTTLAPNVDVVKMVEILGSILVGGLLVAAVVQVIDSRRGRPIIARGPLVNRETWTMPALALLDRPVWSRPTQWTVIAIRVYLVLAAVLLVVRTVQLASGR
ncbi:MAG TPA: NRAMP family divalent metal transporter [Candidatus Dormibacteraeota bacterium]|nr:NRAMP family divalent metal transporter [Candidatus Dormibacteraeota bacterium]